MVCALLGRARRERGCVTPGDDRLETRAYAVKRYLFRLGHAARSARYATSIEQLVVGLAPVMGWGVPPRHAVERACFVRAHRKSVQRWLDDLQVAGVVAHEPERDNLGRWWRTQLVLLTAPAPDRHELAIARKRASAWSRRERMRRRRSRLTRRSLRAIRRRSAAPGRLSCARLGRARALGVHEERRRAAIEQAIAAGRAARELRGLLTHPFGAPPTSAQAEAAPQRSCQTPASDGSLPTAARSTPTLQMTPSLGTGTDARTHAALYRRSGMPDAAQTDGIEEIVRERCAELDERFALRSAALHAQRASRSELQRTHAGRRASETLGWPVGRTCPVGRLREAWVAYRLRPCYRRGAGATRRLRVDRAWS